MEEQTIETDTRNFCFDLVIREVWEANKCGIVHRISVFQVKGENINKLKEKGTLRKRQSLKQKHNTNISPVTIHVSQLEAFSKVNNTLKMAVFKTSTTRLLVKYIHT